MFTTDEPDLQTKALQIYAILLQTYGERPLKPPRRDAMTELIMTILSQRTTAANELLAFTLMWSYYGSWEAIRDADTAKLTELIAASNYPEVKAPHIKATLAQIIEERGAANIDFLEALSAEQGLRWLLALPGVGIKTGSLVLLFNFSKQVIPVDTHVHRVSLRTGLIVPRTSTDQAHTRLLAILPHEPHLLFNFHVTCLRHGQKICTFNAPRCPQCPIKHLCNYYHEVYTAKSS
ncbi:MAG: endonuclease III [Armatimonadetes bacterium]|nr:endonuclease III [Anaerolineae bacterium]